MRRKVRDTVATYHVSLLVDEKFDSLIRKTSSEIHKKYNTEFVVDGTEYLPHLTLYIFGAPTKNQKKIINTLKKEGQNFNIVTIEVKGLTFSWDGWLMVDFRKNNLIDSYHKKVVEKLNPHRNGLQRRKYWDDNKIIGLPKGEWESLKKYGDRHAMKLFNPHMSLTKFENLKEGKEAYDKYKNRFRGMMLKTSALVLIKDADDRSGGIGETLYERKFKNTKG